MRESGQHLDYTKVLRYSMGRWKFIDRLELAWRAFRRPDVYRAAPVIALATLEGTVTADTVITRHDGSKLRISYALTAYYDDGVQAPLCGGGNEHKAVPPDRTD